MRILVGISRIFVGILFIISGLIKLNDPVGFSFKLKDYFAPEVLNLEFLIPYALLIAILLVIFEVLLGVMLLVGYLRKFTVWSLLLMIFFFTFLTFYSAYFNKVTDCGCFGDALKLTPWESFSKDLVLLVLILILFYGRRHISPFFTKNIRSLTVFVSFIFCLGITYQVLEHLPIIDFRPYKIGANITENMTVPADALPPVIEYRWKYDINGEEKVITNTTGADPQPEGGKLISVDTEFLREPYEPPIHDFSIERDGEDYTTSFLEEEHLIVVVAYSLVNSEKDGFFNIQQITNEALKKGYKVIGLSSSATSVTEDLAENYKLNFKFYFCDETALKTIVRSNPSVLELQKGTIIQKLHWNDAKDLKLEVLKSAKPNLDFGLKKRLDSISLLDQRYRDLIHIENPAERKEMGEKMGMSEEEYNGDLWAMQSLLDSTNMVFVEQIFNTRGYPGTSMVGEDSNRAAWLVLQHNPDKIPTYLPLIKKAASEGQLPGTAAAMMEDRFLMNEGKAQIYGTQGRTDEVHGNYIWPIKNPESVNQRREKAGFIQTEEEYAKLLYGEDFKYKVLTLKDVKQ